MCTACQIDTTKAEAFAQNLLTTLNAGGLALMISVGHRTGLFDTMRQLDRPATSREIAAAAGLNERYVREWLGAMTTSRVVTCVPANGTAARYHLPAEHAAFLTREAGADNMGVFAQYIAVLGGVEDRIVDCFHRGGGVAYSEYKRFHEVMAEDSGQSVMHSLVDAILPIVPGIVEALERGIDVLDVGCGCGRALNLMARTFPTSRFVGYDLSEQAIAAARAEAEANGTTNARFVARDLSTFHEDAPMGAFDFVTAFDAIHDQARPDNLLAGIARTLRAGGAFLMQDINTSSEHDKNIDHPMGTLIYTISCMHCMTVSLAQGGMGLGAAWGRERAVEMLAQAGFAHIEIHELPHDIQNCYYVITK